MRVCVFGGGSFGTALAHVLAKNNHEVIIHARNEDVCNSINNEHFNCHYLSDLILPSNITASPDPRAALDRVDFILHTVPVQSSTIYLERLAAFINPKTPIISASKGLHTESLEYMSQLIPRALGRNQPMAFFSGPSFAKELMKQMPTAVVVAAEDESIRLAVQSLFASPCLRVYTTDDVIGVEVGGALKNVFAIAAGIIEGLGLGSNTMAALVTRGCAEMTKLGTLKRIDLCEGVTMGARPRTLAGLSGVGDLMLTCYGSLSRNRSVGKRLGSGESLEEIMSSMKEVAEGVATTPAALKLAQRYSLDLPIIKAVAEVLEGSLSPQHAVEYLMSLPQRNEED